MKKVVMLALLISGSSIQAQPNLEDFYQEVFEKDTLPPLAREKNQFEQYQKDYSGTLIEYTVQKQLKPQNLIGISNEQIDDHWKLYQGYVNQVNTLNEELAKMRYIGKGNSINYADRRRRYGFEYNGMVLHELYFANLKPKQALAPKSELFKEIEKQFGSFNSWHNDFVNAGKTRGVGWGILCRDDTTGTLINIFVDDHQINQIAGFTPLLVMDVWEHAYMVDHKSGGRGEYITAFMKNINWPLIEQRFNQARIGTIPKRY